jgi:hypothetical protein
MSITLSVSPVPAGLYYVLLIGNQPVRGLRSICSEKPLGLAFTGHRPVEEAGHIRVGKMRYALEPALA